MNRNRSGVMTFNYPIYIYISDKSNIGEKKKSEIIKRLLYTLIVKYRDHIHACSIVTPLALRPYMVRTCIPNTRTSLPYLSVSSTSVLLFFHSGARFFCPHTLCNAVKETFEFKRYTSNCRR